MEEGDTPASWLASVVAADRLRLQTETSSLTGMYPSLPGPKGE
jgi:hypothetical protein